MILLGTWITRYWPVSDLQLVLKPWPSILAEFCSILYVDHVRFYLCHPYIERHRRSDNSVVLLIDNQKIQLLLCIIIFTES